MWEHDSEVWILQRARYDISPFRQEHNVAGGFTSKRYDVASDTGDPSATCTCHKRVLKFRQSRVAFLEFADQVE